MAKAILGRKVGMTQVYLEDGTAVPVTVIEAGPCHVLQVRTVDRDGYSAIQVGFGDRSRESVSRSVRGHVAAISSKRSSRASGVEPLPKANCEPKRFIREFRAEGDVPAVGAEIKVDVLDGVKSVDVTGVTRGRGYAGVMKRHNFKGQRATHGVKKVHRHPGGTQAGTYPGRSVKGRKMAGRYGNDQMTMRNLRVVRVDAQNNLLLVRGAIPGAAGGYVIVRETNKVG